MTTTDKDPGKPGIAATDEPRDETWGKVATSSDEIRFLQGLHSLEGRSVLFYDAWRVAGEGSDGTTWSNRNPYARTAHEPERRIDYIFAGYPTQAGAGRIDHCRVVCNEEQACTWPSDHFGLYAELNTSE